MTDDAFVRAILANPSDDALRLVYADWLEEHADSRGAYLRLLCRLSGSSPPSAQEVPSLLAQLEEMRSAIDPAWVGLMHRGRALPVASPPSLRLYEGPDTVAEAMARDRTRERPFNEAEVGVFLRQYGRRGSNDRRYSRKVEKRVKRMKPEDLDRLIRGEEE